MDDAAVLHLDALLAVPGVDPLDGPAQKVRSHENVGQLPLRVPCEFEFCCGVHDPAVREQQQLVQLASERDVLALVLVRAQDPDAGRCPGVEDCAHRGGEGVALPLVEVETSRGRESYGVLTFAVGVQRLALDSRAVLVRTGYVSC